MIDKKYPITRTAFRAWLAEQAKNARYFTSIPHVTKGYDSWSCGCPLATYCHEILKLATVAIGDNYAEDLSKPEGIDRTIKIAGPWAAKFVDLVDNSKVGDRVDARDALLLLDRVTS